MNIWVLLNRFAWGILAVLAAVLLVSHFHPKISEYKELQRRKASLETRILSEEERLVSLKRQQERLQSDPRFAERIAREEFGLVKQGETVLRFVDEDGAASDAR